MSKPKLTLIRCNPDIEPAETELTGRDLAADLLRNMELAVSESGVVHLGREYRPTGETVWLVEVRQGAGGKLEAEALHGELSGRFCAIWSWAAERLGSSLEEVLRASIQQQRQQPGLEQRTGVQVWLRMTNEGSHIGSKDGGE